MLGAPSTSGCPPFFFLHRPPAVPPHSDRPVPPQLPTWHKWCRRIHSAAHSPPSSPSPFPVTPSTKPPTATINGRPAELHAATSGLSPPTPYKGRAGPPLHFAPLPFSPPSPQRRRGRSCPPPVADLLLRLSFCVSELWVRFLVLLAFFLFLSHRVWCSRTRIQVAPVSSAAARCHRRRPSSRRPRSWAGKAVRLHGRSR
jgi:hypothetical protein